VRESENSRRLQCFLRMCAVNGHVRAAGAYVDSTVDSLLSRHYRRAQHPDGLGDLALACGIVASALIGLILWGPQ
jgi:hypothetical protein